MRIDSLALVLLLTLGGGAAAQDSMPGDEQCLGCHDFGPESPVHAVLDGSHGAEIGEGTGKGCLGCHGASGDHASSPTQVSPTVSFGPRWTAPAAAQDLPCLSCHEDDAAAHWSDALHMLNNLTCVACHDIHAPRDRVLFAEQQAEVCTVCHKAQRQGVHGLEEELQSNPSCTSCHNPHDHESPVAEMLDNRSEGCRACHDLVAMAAVGVSTAKAQSYHKVMTQADRTCLDCHQGISHAPADSVLPMTPEAVTERQITLFFPGQSHSEWLLTDHPGSQPLRQGHNCQQCHRGDEAAMGEALASGFEPSARSLDVAFSRQGDRLTMALSWEGPASDQVLSVMWGDRDAPTFQRGGCFAACHSDMPGMTRDRGQQMDKYLMASRLQQSAVGRPALVKDDSQLSALRDQGRYVEAWRVDLDNPGAGVETAALLESLDWRRDDRLDLRLDRDDGRWTLRITRPLGALQGLKTFDEEARLTFGIALNGDDNPGGRHWVSLPLTMGLTAEHTDFRAE